jgi:hypothetical protein
MFHLFDKVYLSFDHQIDAYVNRVVFSKANGVSDGVSNEHSTLYFYGKTVSEVIGADKQFKDFLEFFKELKNIGDLNGGQRVILYCDKEAFTNLFVAWHKAILDKTSVDSLWKIFRLSLEKESYLSAFTDVESYVMSEELASLAKSKKAFEEVYNKVPDTKDRMWNLDMIKSFGIEYLISTFVATNDPAIKTILKSKLLNLTFRSLLGEIYEAKLQLVLRYQDGRLHQLLGLNNVENLDDVLSHPKVSIFADPEVWKSNSRYFPTPNSSLVISALDADKLARLVEAFNFVRLELDGMLPTCTQAVKINRLKWVVENSISDDALSALLLDPSFVGSEVTGNVDIDKVNALFVDWILNLHRSKNLSDLEYLQLAR